MARRSVETFALGRSASITREILRERMRSSKRLKWARSAFTFLVILLAYHLRVSNTQHAAEQLTGVLEYILFPPPPRDRLEN